MSESQHCYPPKLSKENLKDKIRGCLFGNAVGDAYGLATEFMTKSEATARYGNGPIEFGTEKGYPFWMDRHRSKWERNDFTDDTDQLLLLLQALQRTKDGRLHPILFARGLHEWSQKGFPELGTPPRGIGYTVGCTLSHPEFKSNPHKASFDVWDKNGRYLAANGAVMRTSVLGIESFWDEAQVVENTLAAAKVTHADPRSLISAVLASVLISRLLRGGGTDLDADKDRVWNPRLVHQEYRQELLAYLERGSDLGGEHSVEPTYEQESEQTAFKEKDRPGIPIGSAPTGHTQSTPTDPGFFATLVQNIINPMLLVLSWVGIRLRHESPRRVNRFFSENWNKDRPIVQLREDVGWIGIDRVGEDPAIGSLARSTLANYMFLLKETKVLPRANDQGGNLRPNLMDQNHDAEASTDDSYSPEAIQTKWVQELQSSCFPAYLKDLKLDDRREMGYAFKCIGVSYYGATRCVSKDAVTDPVYEGNQGLFRGVLEQVTLEAGDADTNGAVLGALLGTRFGLEDGIPKSWSNGLQHREWVETTIEEFLERVVDQYEQHSQSQNA